MTNNYVNENQKTNGVIEHSDEKVLNAGRPSNADKVYYEFLKNMKSQKFDDFEDYSTVFMTF
jgi:hypothetical protein